MLSKKSGKGNRMVVDDKWTHDWALYSGDKFVTMGTLYEISEYTGTSLDALKQYSRKYPANRISSKNAIYRQGLHSLHFCSNKNNGENHDSDKRWSMVKY